MQLFRFSVDNLQYFLHPECCLNFVEGYSERSEMHCSYHSSTVYDEIDPREYKMW